MTSPKHRSRSLRRVKKKVPGGRTALSHEKRRPGKAKCAECGAELKGMPRLHPCKAKKTPRSVKRTQRPYGGYLCAACAKEKIKQEARLNNH